MPRLPNSLKPKPSLSPIPPIFTTPKPIEKRLTPESLTVRQKLDELQGSLRAHAEHQQRVSDYLSIVKAVRTDEEDSVVNTPSGGETGGMIPQLTLDILDLLDQLVEEADQRLIDTAIKENGPSNGMLQTETEANSKVPGSHLECAQPRFKLPSWEKIIEEEVPSSSKLNRSLSNDAAVTPPAFDLTEGLIQGTSELFEESSEEFEPPVTTPLGVKALFEAILGPRKIDEHPPEILMSEGEEEANLKAGCQRNGGKEVSSPGIQSQPYSSETSTNMFLSYLRIISPRWKC